MTTKEISAEEKLQQLSKQYNDACERLTMSQAQCIADSNNALQSLREFAELKDRYYVFAIEQLQKKPEPVKDSVKFEPTVVEPAKVEEPAKPAEPVEKREDNLKPSGN